MQNKVTALLVVLLIAARSGFASAEELTEKELQKLYTNYLIEQGYRPQIDGDGDVTFKKEGKTYFLGIDEGDQNYFMMVYPNFWEIEDPAERRRAMIAADTANARSKVAKVYTMHDNVWASVELFIDKPEDFQPIFDRSMSALENIVENFVSKMREMNDNYDN